MLRLQRILVTSYGLWRQRADMARLFAADGELGGKVVILPPGTPSYLAQRVVGWGERPSGRKARRIALRRELPLTLIEDGFLHGWKPGSDVPRASYLLDSHAAHYDGTRESDLERAILADDFEPADLVRARDLVDLLRETRVSKYNAAPLVPAERMVPDRYVLLVEQVEGDMSLEGVEPDVFERMVRHAREAYPGHRLVVRAHPAAEGAGPLSRAAPDAIVPPPCNIWPLLEHATRVYTVSSHAGFEALMAGTPVTCFGSPFYAGWGLTDDRVEHPRRNARRSLGTLAAAAYLDARYLDIHTREVTTPEATVETLAAVRDARLRNRDTVVTAGFSPWRKRAATPFLVSNGNTNGGRPLHESSRENAEFVAAQHQGDLVVWGADEPTSAAANVRTVRLEDGFLRSVGLGAALALPLSLVRETGHLHFDARGPSGVERALLGDPPSLIEEERASRLMETIRAARITKYNQRSKAPPLPETDRLKVLVVGQVEDDASIRYGAPGVNTNTNLLIAVRDLFPDALIAYRDHPDVAAGLRSGKAARLHVDVNADRHDILDLFDWADRLETMTSLAGFEALMRGLPVGTHGWPFYAGWGLTDDRLDREPRGEASLEALATATLIRYADYVHPVSRLPCSPERAVAALAELRRNPSLAGLLRRMLLGRGGWAVGRAKHLSRRFARATARRP